VNGWDRNPQYEPRFGWTGILAVIVIIEVALILAFGWRFT
jgi:hypothetical protein